VSEPTTPSGRALAERFPFKSTEQTCCPYPHDEDSGPDIQPRHLRSTKTERRTAANLAIEAEARALLLDELEAAVRELPVVNDGDCAQHYGNLTYSCTCKVEVAAVTALIQRHGETRA
jgi:hypothetical protein